MRSKRPPEHQAQRCRSYDSFGGTPGFEVTVTASVVGTIDVDIDADTALIVTAAEAQSTPTLHPTGPPKAISIGRRGEGSLARERPIISIDCSELTVDEQIALASAVSDGLSGKGVALIKDDTIVLDLLSNDISSDEVVRLVKGWVSKRKDAELYSVETDEDEIVVHSPDPLSRSRGRKDTGQLLPENLLKCPYCAFVTPYRELYDVHVRSHLFGV